MIHHDTLSLILCHPVCDVTTLRPEAPAEYYASINVRVQGLQPHLFCKHSPRNKLKHGPQLTHMSMPVSQCVVTHSWQPVPPGRSLMMLATWGRHVVANGDGPWKLRPSSHLFEAAQMLLCNIQKAWTWSKFEFKCRRRLAFTEQAMCSQVVKPSSKNELSLSDNIYSI